MISGSGCLILRPYDFVIQPPTVDAPVLFRRGEGLGRIPIYLIEGLPCSILYAGTNLVRGYQLISCVSTKATSRRVPSATASAIGIQSYLFKRLQRSRIVLPQKMVACPFSSASDSWSFPASRERQLRIIGPEFKKIRKNQ